MQDSNGILHVNGTNGAIHTRNHVFIRLQPVFSLLLLCHEIHPDFDCEGGRLVQWITVTTTAWIPYHPV